MALVDKTLVLRKLSELDEYLQQVGEFGDITVETYKADWKARRIIERTLQMMLEVCVDIANHIIADEAGRAPTSYADSFAVLRESHVLDVELEATLKEMAKFRNILVHGYDKVDEAIVVGILSQRLGDFADYKKAILSYLERE